jgi:hypothetical protein
LALEAAPLDDEELSPEDVASILDAEASVGRGESTSHEDMMREFGLESD